MRINWLLAISTSMLYWILIFVAVSVLMFIPVIGTNYKVWLLVVEPFLAIFCAYLYFKKTSADLKHGFLVGLLVLVIGNILDLIITLPLFVKSFNFYKEWNLWVGFVETLIVFSLFPVVFKKKEFATQISQQEKQNL